MTASHNQCRGRLELEDLNLERAKWPEIFPLYCPLNA